MNVLKLKEDKFILQPTNDKGKVLYPILESAKRSPALKNAKALIKQRQRIEKAKGL